MLNLSVRVKIKNKLVFMRLNKNYIIKCSFFKPNLIFINKSDNIFDLESDWYV